MAKNSMNKDPVRVLDIDPKKIRPPFAFDIGRAVVAPYSQNGSKSLNMHLAPKKDFEGSNFFVTAIVDETHPDKANPKAKLMVQGGTQYGCSVRNCPGCAFTRVKFRRDLSVREIVDKFRLALYAHSTINEHSKDKRILDIKFTDNGEPLETPNVTRALTSLLKLFGKEGKILRFKISTILKNTPTTRGTFKKILDWQRRNIGKASIHLQISRTSNDSSLIPGQEVAMMIRDWSKANPGDKVCVTPHLMKGFRDNNLEKFYASLLPVKSKLFMRLAVIKPSDNRKTSRILDGGELGEINAKLAGMGFEVAPLPTENDQIYKMQMQSAGTLAHRPNGKLFDPKKYKVLEYGGAEINEPIERRRK